MSYTVVRWQMYQTCPTTQPSYLGLCDPEAADVVGHAPGRRDWRARGGPLLGRAGRGRVGGAEARGAGPDWWSLLEILRYRHVHPAVLQSREIIALSPAGKTRLPCWREASMQDVLWSIIILLIISLVKSVKYSLGQLGDDWCWCRYYLWIAWHKSGTKVKWYVLNIIKGKISIEPQSLNSVAYLVLLSPEQTEESDVSPPFLLVSGKLLAFPTPCVKHVNDY